MLTESSMLCLLLCTEAVVADTEIPDDLKA